MNNIRIELKWAFISFVFVLGWMAMERLIGLHDKYIHFHAQLTMLVLIPSIMINYLFLKDKKSNFYLNQMSFKQGFTSGLIYTVFNLIFTPIFQWITSTIITPYYFRNAINYSVSTHQYSIEAAEEYFNMNSYIIQSMIGTFVVGIILSLIFAFFLRTKNE